MSLQLVEWTTNWPLVLSYFDGSVPAGFPSPAEDYLETPLDLHDFLIDNKAARSLCGLMATPCETPASSTAIFSSWIALPNTGTDVSLSWPSTARTR